MDEVNFHFFNVNNGDSIVLELIKERKSFYLLIDSHSLIKNNTITYPAIEFLNSKNVKSLAAVVITHFHKDHITGIEKILSEFEINKLCIPPVISRKASSFEKKLAQYKEKLLETINITSDDQVISELTSLAHIIKYIKNNEDKIQELEGRESIFRIADIDIALGKVYLPVPRFKGALGDKIIHGNFQLDTFPEMNDMSVAICFTFFDQNILLTGDSSLRQWGEHKRQMKFDNIDNLNISLLKVSHHGSKYNNTQELYNYFFKSYTPKKNIFISANGKSHPDDEMFDLIKTNNLLPHCTNLATLCAGTLNYFNATPELKDALPFLINYEKEQKFSPCQGNIRLKIDEQGLTINNSTGFNCIYH